MKHIAFGLGLAVASIGLSTLAGYLLGMTRLYNWDGAVGMAVNTGVALTLAGIAITLLACRASCYYVRGKE